MTDQQKTEVATKKASSATCIVNKVCCITLNATDCIRLIAVPVDLRGVLRVAIEKSWGKIQSEKDYYGSYQFKLKGCPWLGQISDAVLSRRLLVAILKVMAQQGWNLIQAADTSKKVCDKDSLYFEMAEADPEAQLFGLSFNMGNRIRLIDAPFQMREVLNQAVAARTVIQKSKMYYGSFQLKVSGQPWYYAGPQGVHTKLLLLQIIADFRAQGYKLYASVDISYGGYGSSDEGADLESWVFRKLSPPFWQ